MKGERDERSLMVGKFLKMRGKKMEKALLWERKISQNKMKKMQEA
jgi:hypothetical protein